MPHNVANPIHLDTVFVCCALAVALVGAITDVRSRRIPNWLTYGAILSGIAIRTLLLGWHGLTSSVLGLIGGAGILILLFILGGMGGGDVKLMGAVGAWVGGVQVLTVLTAAAVAAAVASIGFMLFRGIAWVTLFNIVELVKHHVTSGLKPHPELNVRESHAVRVPFAPAIAFGTLYSVSQTLFWG